MASITTEGLRKPIQINPWGLRVSQLYQHCTKHWTSVYIQHILYFLLQYSPKKGQAFSECTFVQSLCKKGWLWIGIGMECNFMGGGHHNMAPYVQLGGPPLQIPPVLQCTYDHRTYNNYTYNHCREGWIRCHKPNMLWFQLRVQIVWHLWYSTCPCTELPYHGFDWLTCVQPALHLKSQCLPYRLGSLGCTL